MLTWTSFKPIEMNNEHHIKILVNWNYSAKSIASELLSGAILNNPWHPPAITSRSQKWPNSFKSKMFGKMCKFRWIWPYFLLFVSWFHPWFLPKFHQKSSKKNRWPWYAVSLNVSNDWVTDQSNFMTFHKPKIMGKSLHRLCSEIGFPGCTRSGSTSRNQCCHKISMYFRSVWWLVIPSKFQQKIFFVCFDIDFIYSMDYR